MGIVFDECVLVVIGGYVVDVIIDLMFGDIWFDCGYYIGEVDV